MTPIFPLSLVPFVGEPLNLHIFEDRYKELVSDCLRVGQAFGIPPFIGGKLCEYGGLLVIEEVETTYEDGRLDIRTRCRGRFKLLHHANPLEGHLYAAAEIEELGPDEPSRAEPATEHHFLFMLGELYGMMNAQVPPGIADALSPALRIGHKIGLSLEQEYQLFLLRTEEERQQYLIQHVESTLPSMREMERTRQLIRMNGHFQRFDPLTF